MKRRDGQCVEKGLGKTAASGHCRSGFPASVSRTWHDACPESGGQWGWLVPVFYGADILRVAVDEYGNGFVMFWG